MFYLDEDSEDEEEKVPEGVYHGKAPAGILVSDIHQHTNHPRPPPLNTNLEPAARRGQDRAPTRESSDTFLWRV